MAVSKIDVVDRFFNDSGALLAGGKVYTYVANTNTPLATYTDSSGTTAHTNPIILDASGNTQIWFLKGSSYKVTFKDANGVSVGDDLNGLTIPNDGAGTTATAQFGLDFLYHGNAPPVASEWLGGYSVTVALTLPANFAGASGAIRTNPAASFAIGLRKNSTAFDNGTSIGSVTIGTGGTFTFASASGSAVSLAVGDWIDAWGPATADTTANNFNFTLLGTVAA